MSKNTDTYKNVIITNKARTLRIHCKNEKDYKRELSENPALCELIGFYNQQVKPCFDVDAYEKDIDVNEIIKLINVIFPKTKVNHAKREPRLVDGKIKWSYRFYVHGVRMTTKNLKILLANYGYDLKTNNNKPFDMSIYGSNHVLFLPFSTRKFENQEVPSLTPIDCSIFDCCASYIEEEYEDWDLKMPKVEPEMPKMKKELYDEAVIYDGNLNFTEIITKYSIDRATDYPTWFYMGVALINLFHRKIITRGQVYDLFELFSKKGDNYDANTVSNLIDIHIPRFDGKGYGIKYMLECLKADDLEYYKLITKTCMMIDGSNDDIGASKIVVEYYKNSLIICNNILYVKDNNIWECNEKQVDKILLNNVGEMDIKFVGADGKRKYSYSNSIKHIKDCITGIKANKTIINNEFYNDMIKNNKYYLPFNDGIYSFKEKKLFKYEEKPNIHFIQKINRNFPIFNQQDLNNLKEKVLNPIYPNEEEQIYNAHIKSRALAGCYEDKVWYGYSGSRNSGKGVETNLLRSGFGNYVAEFNSKCLINNKFGNPDQAKALSWVIDKKDARIIISNEIDGDDNTKMNGNFIKTLSSGGDAMEARKNYQDEQKFIPQFTMFLCYNKLYDVEPADAKENLIEFEYKSKFVPADELIEGVPYLKLADPEIKEFIKENRIIDAYIGYILNAFTNPRMDIPQSIKNSTELGNGEIELTIEQFIVKNFKTTTNSLDRLHTEQITKILNNNNYKINSMLAGKLMNRMGVGKYNRLCNINSIKKGGYDFIKFIGTTDEV